MNFVSLFAGIGGFDLGFENAGMTCVGQVEIDKHAVTVLDRHWPDVPRWNDIHDVKGADIGSAVDVLTGGFPCQDYSIAGSRFGLAGDRGALWWQYHRLIGELRPTWVVGENVPGLLSASEGRDFGTIIRSLVDLGYGVVWSVLDSQYYGLAQRRRRVFIVGHSGGIPRPEVLAIGEGCAGDSPPDRQPRETVAPTLTARTRGGGGLGTDFDLDGGLIYTDEVSYALTARAAMDRPERGAASFVVYQPTVTGTLMARDAKSVRLDIDEPSLIAFNWQTGNGRHGANSTHSGSLISSQVPAVHTDSQVRRLTPLECERLQGFPDNWTASQSTTQRYRQLGNAVSVPVVEWIAHRIMRSQ